MLDNFIKDNNSSFQNIFHNIFEELRFQKCTLEELYYNIKADTMSLRFCKDMLFLLKKNSIRTPVEL